MWFNVWLAKRTQPIRLADARGKHFGPQTGIAFADKRCVKVNVFCIIGILSSRSSRLVGECRGSPALPSRTPSPSTRS